MQSAEHKTQHASWRVDVAENVYTSLYGPGCVLREEASFLGEVKPPAWSPNTAVLPTFFFLRNLALFYKSMVFEHSKVS